MLLIVGSSLGKIVYHGGPILSGRQDIGSILREEFFYKPALAPPIGGLRDRGVAPPELELDAEGVQLSHPELETLRAWVVYRDGLDGFSPDSILPVSHDRVDPPRGDGRAPRWGATASKVRAACSSALERASFSES